MLGELIGHSLSFDAPVTVLDLNTGGFSIETATPLPLEETHEFRFSLSTGVSAIVLARVVHQRRSDRNASGTHVVGLEFLDGSPEAKASRTVLVDRILSGAKKRVG